MKLMLGLLLASVIAGAVLDLLFGPGLLLFFGLALLFLLWTAQGGIAGGIPTKG